MLRLFGGLTERYVISFLAATAATLSLATIAAWTEGRAPRWSTLTEGVPTLAASLAGAWTIARWRAEGGDIAVASLGRSPALLWIFIIGLTLPVLAWSQPSIEPQKESAMVFAPNMIELRSRAGTTRYSWNDGVVTRSEPDGSTSSHRGFPPPVTTSKPLPSPSPWIPMVLRCLIAAVPLAWLGVTREAPGLTATLGAGAAAFIGSIGLDALVFHWVS